MCPGLRPEMARMPSIVLDREEPAQRFARSFSDHFRQQTWEETFREAFVRSYNEHVEQARNTGPEGLAELICDSSRSFFGKLPVLSRCWHGNIFKEYFKGNFISIAVCLTYALAGLDVLSRHLSYPEIASAGGKSRLITGYFSLTISSAKLFFNISLYAAVCCLCLLLYLKPQTSVYNVQQQQQPIPVDDVNDPGNLNDAAQRLIESEAIVTQVVAALLTLPIVVFHGSLTFVLKAICLQSLLLGTLASLLSFIIPSLWQIFFWGIALIVVYFVSFFLTIVIATSPEAVPIRDLEA